MAEKRVSVRLAAVGGKQVRAELEGVGDAGVKGFGRMSKEAEIANARLAAFSTRVKIAAAVAVAAAAAAGIAMIRSGLETIDAQANLAQSLGTTTRSIQVLTFAGDLAGVSMDEIAAATKKLTLKLSDAAGGTGTAVTALQRLHLTATDLQALPLDERIVAIQDALAKFVPPAERAAVASALFGDKAALAFSRIDSATLRQASQDITDFGVAVSDQDADQIRTAGDAIDRLGLVWLGLTNQLTVAVAPALETVANALADATRVGGVFQTSIAFLGDHIGEIASIAGAFATFFAGRFIIALGAAALGVSGFSLSLTVLKGALIRSGIGALIVGAGELVYQFSKLVEGAGGFGAALAQLFAGENLLALQTAPGIWELIQFGTATIVSPGRWTLSRLLRGQAGTEDAMIPFAPIGSRIVFLGATMVALPITESEIGMPWNWRIGPGDRGAGDALNLGLTFTPQGRGLRPWSPVRITGVWLGSGDIAVSWLRRTRSLAGDSWTAPEVPLGEASESWDILVLNGAGATIRNVAGLASAAWTYTAAMQTADFGGPVASLRLRIFQNGQLGRGAPADVTLTP